MTRWEGAPRSAPVNLNGLGHLTQIKVNTESGIAFVHLFHCNAGGLEFEEVLEQAKGYVDAHIIPAIPFAFKYSSVPRRLGTVSASMLC